MITIYKRLKLDLEAWEDIILVAHTFFNGKDGGLLAMPLCIAQLFVEPADHTV